MTDSLIRRGPEAEGFFLSGSVALGHRRLKIIDLSEAANQPMTSADGRWVMVYNGELYNYRQLRDRYLTSIKLHTSSDTEVLLELFALKGLSILPELNGMFAIALYDLREQELHLIRDETGIKPLIYAFQGQHLFFGSELKAILSNHRVQRKLDQSALNLFLQLGYIPAPLTAYEQVFKLPPGTLLTYANGKISLHHWAHDKKNSDHPKLSDEKAALDQLDELMQEVISDQMLADVPLGIFLSGGVDSTLVATYAARQKSGIATFSIGLENPQLSELPYASWVAGQLGTRHTELIVTADEVMELIPTLTQVYDEPYGDSSALPTLLISELARRQVTVSLSGDGGDELFLGYGLYQWPERLDNPIRRSAGRLLFQTLALFDQEHWHKASRMFSQGENPSALFSIEHGYFTPMEAQRLIGGSPFPYKLFSDRDSTGLRLDERQALFDQCYYLPDDLLKKVDRASMWHSLEVRVPLLDKRIINFADRLHPNLKWKDGLRKYLLRRLLSRELPGYDVIRPKKGFSVPLKDWLQGPMSGLLTEWLSKTAIQQAGVLDLDQCQQLLRKFQNGHSYLYHQIWLLIVLQQFLLKGK